MATTFAPLEGTEMNSLDSLPRPEFVPRFLSLECSFQSTRSGQRPDARFCRICQDDDPASRLLSPCRCAGTCRNVHRECLEKWLSTSNHTSCEMCGYEYKVTKRPRPISHWFLNATFSADRHNLSADVFCFFVLTPLGILSTYLCITGAIHYIGNGPGGHLEATGLISLCTFLILIYLIWFVLTVRFHVKVVKDWKSQNQEIRLADVTESKV